MYLWVKDAATMRQARAFLDKYKDADLPLLNQVECALLRATRKGNVFAAVPDTEGANCARHGVSARAN